MSAHSRSTINTRFSRQEGPACKTESLTEMGLQGKSEGMSPGLSGEAKEFGQPATSGQPRACRGHRPAGGSRQRAGMGPDACQGPAEPWARARSQSCKGKHYTTTSLTTSVERVKLIHSSSAKLWLEGVGEGRPPSSGTLCPCWFN